MLYADTSTPKTLHQPRISMQPGANRLGKTHSSGLGMFVFAEEELLLAAIFEKIQNWTGQAKREVGSLLLGIKNRKYKRYVCRVVTLCLFGNQ